MSCLEIGIRYFTSSFSVLTFPVLPSGKQESGCAEQVQGTLVDTVLNSVPWQQRKPTAPLGCTNSSADGGSKEAIICLCYARQSTSTVLIPAVVPQNGKNNMFSKGLPRLLGNAALVLWGEGERAGLVQLEKRRDWPSGDLLTACLHLHELTGRTTRLFTALHGAMGVNWDKRFRLDIRRNLFPGGQAGSRTSCPERLCCLHPLRFSGLSNPITDHALSRRLG